jgi:hypothetical protein
MWIRGRNLRVQAEAQPPPQTADDERRSPSEVIDLEVRHTGGKFVAEPVPEASLARTAGEMAMSLWISSLRTGFRLGRSVLSAASASSIGRVIGDMAAGAADTATSELSRNWASVERNAEHGIGQVISVVVPVVVQALDPEELMEYLDIDAILEAVDVNALLRQVDVDQLLDRVDVNALLDRVDVDGLMQRADVDALVSRVDVDALMARVDIEALLDRVDVAGLAKRAKVGELVAESTSDVAGSALDLGRRQAVGVDTVLSRSINRLLGRDPDAMPEGPASLLAPPEDSES